MRKRDTGAQTGSSGVTYGSPSSLHTEQRGLFNPPVAAWGLPHTLIQIRGFQISWRNRLGTRSLYEETQAWHRLSQKCASANLT